MEVSKDTVICTLAFVCDRPSCGHFIPHEHRRVCEEPSPCPHAKIDLKIRAVCIPINH